MPQGARKCGSVSLLEAVTEEIKHRIKKKSDIGYKSMAEFIMDSIRRNPNYLERMEHYKVYENHVTIFDKSIKTLVDVYFQDEGLYCDHFDSTKCDPTESLLSLPKVINILKVRDWTVEKESAVSFSVLKYKQIGHAQNIIGEGLDFNLYHKIVYLRNCNEN